MARDPDPWSQEERLVGLAGALTEADAGADAEGLAVIAWQLLTELGTAGWAWRGAELRCAALRTAARASVASADQGDRDPLAHLRHVLAEFGCSPAPGASVLALLAEAPHPLADPGCALAGSEAR